MISFLGGLVGLVSWVIILAHAFRNEWWKGLLCLVPCCLPYLIYYMFVEFEHPHKWKIIFAFWIGGFVSGWNFWPWR